MTLPFAIVLDLPNFQMLLKMCYRNQKSTIWVVYHISHTLVVLVDIFSAPLLVVPGGDSIDEGTYKNAEKWVGMNIYMWCGIVSKSVKISPFVMMRFAYKQPWPIICWPLHVHFHLWPRELLLHAVVGKGLCRHNLEKSQFVVGVWSIFPQ